MTDPQDSTPEPQGAPNELQQIRDELARTRSTAQAALLGLMFAVGLVAALLAQPKASTVNLRGNLLVNLRPVRPQGANLQRVVLDGAQLTRADLAGADLSFSTLTDVDLSQANLARSSLRGAELQDVDLSRANLTDVDLAGAEYDRSTRWPRGFDPQAQGAGLRE